MYLVTGNNLFGQWLKDSIILERFDQISSDIFKHTTEILCTNWSYNIIRQDDDKIFVTGFWNGNDKQFEEIVIPKRDVNVSDLVINGNDKYIIFGRINTNTVNILEIESKKWNEVNLAAETPVESKRRKLTERNNLTISICNDNIMYLNGNGDVYSGLLPSYIDTRKCVGTVIDVKCGYEHNFILTDEGMVYTWGNGRRLQLGHEDVSTIEVPTLVEALSGIKITKIAAGGWHSMALSEFGDVYAWGWNDSGQLGIFNEERNTGKSLKSYAVPTIVDFFDEEKQKLEDVSVRDIGCGSKHSVVLLDDGTVWVTGNNKYGQLGLKIKDNPKVNYFKKSKIDDVNVKSIKCGVWTTLLVTK